MGIDSVKSPRKCSPEEIEDFLELLRSRRDVREENLLRRIRKARSLAFHYENHSLAGISAVKKASKAYLKKLEALACWENTVGVKYEIGWAYVLEEYRNRGIAGTLLDLLLLTNPRLPTFSVVRTDNQIACRILFKHDYLRCGSPFHWCNNERVIFVRRALSTGTN